MELSLIIKVVNVYPTKEALDIELAIGQYTDVYNYVHKELHIQCDEDITCYHYGWWSIETLRAYCYITTE